MKIKNKLNILLASLLSAVLYAGTANAETKACWPEGEVHGVSMFGWSYNPLKDEEVETVLGVLTRYKGNPVNSFIEQRGMVINMQGINEEMNVTKDGPKVEKISWSLVKIGNGNFYTFLVNGKESRLECKDTQNKCVDAAVPPAKAKSDEFETIVVGSPFGPQTCIKVKKKSEKKD